MNKLIRTNGPINLKLNSICIRSKPKHSSIHRSLGRTSLHEVIGHFSRITFLNLLKQNLDQYAIHRKLPSKTQITFVSHCQHVGETFPFCLENREQRLCPVNLSPKMQKLPTKVLMRGRLLVDHTNPN